MIKKKFDIIFKFHSNGDITKYSLNNFSRFYYEIRPRWSKYIFFPVRLPSAITSQFLCFNFKKKGLNFVGQLFDFERKLKSWTAIKNEHHLIESKSFHCMQLVDALETPWKRSTRGQNTNF